MKEITVPGTIVAYDGTDQAFAPDGTMIAYEGIAADGTTNKLYVTDLNSGAAALVSGEAPGMTIPDDNLEIPALFRNGKSVLFSGLNSSSLRGNGEAGIPFNDLVTGTAALMSAAGACKTSAASNTHSAAVNGNMTRVGTAAAGPQANAGTVSAVTALAVDVAVSEHLAQTGVTLTGAGEKIGILSDSFNVLGGEAGDIAAGLLPAAANIHILADGIGGDSDEGRAMAQQVYAIAPGAQIDFYTAANSESDFANGITALAAAGCNVIVDDYTYTETEPFYQSSGTITQAVENAIAGGVSYFTSAGNDSNNFYEAAFNPMTFALPGIGTELTHNVAGGSPYEAVSLPTFPYLDLSLQWEQPFGGSQYDIGVGLYKLIGASYYLVENFTTSALGGDPILQIQTGNLVGTPAGTYYLAFYESGAAPGAPAPGEFKIISWEDSSLTIDGIGSGTGSGTSIGHELAPGANTVAAVDVNQTPAAGVAVPVVESFSSAGPGVTYYNASGTLLPTPVVDGNPQFAATDGSPTSVFNPFYGTSAAAPNAAAVALLMLQANARLAPAQVTYLLERSAISTGDSITGGAGLIQADTAVSGAYTAAITPIWTGQDGTLWSQALDWSDSAAPGAGAAAMITDGIGIFAGAYDVMFDEASAAIGALTVDGGVFKPASPDLLVRAGDTLHTGSLTLGHGTIDIFGSLNDTGNIFSGSDTGKIYLESDSELRVAGTAGAAAIDFSGTGGELELAATGTTDIALGIGSFAVGDVLDLTGIATSLVKKVSISGGTVSVLGPASQLLDALQVSGNFSGIGFAPDGTGGTILYAACFAAGTRIITASGAPVAIENLRPSDLVITKGGDARPILWLGHRTIDCDYHPDPKAVWPVLIRQGAFAEGVPARDLFVSPGHSIYVEGRLMQAENLVNGATILQIQVPRVTYWHVELDQHDIIFAEGLPAETYLDTGNRAAFINGGTYIEAHPDFRPKHWAETCVPLVFAGPEMQAAKTALLARAAELGHRITHEDDLHIIADDQRFDPVRLSDARAAFLLPKGCEAITLASRTFIPTHADPRSRDGRTLGVRVKRLQIDGTDVAMDDEAAFGVGWHHHEPHENSNGARWTTGSTPSLRQPGS